MTGPGGHNYWDGPDYMPNPFDYGLPNNYDNQVFREREKAPPTYTDLCASNKSHRWSIRLGFALAAAYVALTVFSVVNQPKTAEQVENERKTARNKELSALKARSGRTNEDGKWTIWPDPLSEKPATMQECVDYTTEFVRYPSRIGAVNGKGYYALFGRGEIIGNFGCIKKGTWAETWTEVDKYDSTRNTPEKMSEKSRFCCKDDICNDILEKAAAIRTPITKEEAGKIAAVLMNDHVYDGLKEMPLSECIPHAKRLEKITNSLGYDISISIRIQHTSRFDQVLIMRTGLKPETAMSGYTPSWLTIDQAQNLLKKSKNNGNNGKGSAKPHSFALPHGSDRMQNEQIFYANRNIAEKNRSNMHIFLQEKYCGRRDAPIRQEARMPLRA